MLRENKVLVIGLDCASPQLMFDKWQDSLPHIKSLMDRGIYGELKSTIPPITIPAWTSMFTSKDPGQLGFYGFRNRGSFNYDELYTATANYIKERTLWNYLSLNRKTSIVINVPQTFPPKPLRGIMVSSFLTPNKDVSFTYPVEIKKEIESIADNNYIIDVKDFRTSEKERLKNSIYEMTEKRFKIIKRYISEKFWDLFIFVETGMDRLQHGFWRYTDTSHRLYEKGNPYQNVIKEYYQYLDQEIGEVISFLEKGTDIIVVSDHGAKAMVGGICINEWLQKEGYLTLKEKIKEKTPLKKEMIDWSKTYVWAEGGYYGRIFFNIKGREPEGKLNLSDYERFRERLKKELEDISDEEGKNIGSKVFIPDEIYRECRNIPPDLIVYFGDLNWRSVGSIGINKVHIFENDTGLDDANHTEYGVFIMAKKGEELKNKGKREDIKIYDIAPTILNLFGCEVPKDMIGKVIK